ncbi:hypothetical protein HPB49_018744 [Dermacentor silvarum]|uniref:Uncharacterized protein n=1 Tax=Dermacentor silvarum TaxID=543639 RepID=A0ACB8DEK3_DERSI|nr:hypothetical protein HPB49_018744 [Dermacentor silvarum]
MSWTKPTVAALDASSAGRADGDSPKVERPQKSAESRLPTLEEFLEKRGFTGAMALLEFIGTFSSSSQSSRLEAALWTAYCAFHLGQHRHATRIYQEMLADKSMPSRCDNLQKMTMTRAVIARELGLFAATVVLFNHNCLRRVELPCVLPVPPGLVPRGRSVGTKGPLEPAAERLLFHLAHKAGYENRLMALLESLQDILEDQLSVASIHYLSELVMDEEEAEQAAAPATADKSGTDQGADKEDRVSGLQTPGMTVSSVASLKCKQAASIKPAVDESAVGKIEAEATPAKRRHHDMVAVSQEQRLRQVEASLEANGVQKEPRYAVQTSASSLTSGGKEVNS